MSRPPFIPPGLWPPRMPADMAAGYCGERSVEAFLSAVRRGEYPQPRIKQGRRRIWLKEDLDRVIQTSGGGVFETAEEVLEDLS